MAARDDHQYLAGMEPPWACQRAVPAGLHPRRAPFVALVDEGEEQ